MSLFSLRRPRRKAPHRQPAHRGPRVFTDSRGNAWTVQAKAPAAPLAAPVVADDTMTDWQPGYDETATITGYGRLMDEAAAQDVPEAAHEAREIHPQIAAKLAELSEQAQAEQKFAGRHRPAAPPWGSWDQPGASLAGQGGPLHDDPRWYGYAGITMPDNRTPMERPFAPGIPGVLGQQERLSPRTAPVLADLGGLTLFREAVRAELVRADAARGIRPDGGPWDAQYAAALERRTALPSLPDFDFAAMMRAHYTGPVVILPRHLVALDETGTGAAA